MESKQNIIEALRLNAAEVFKVTQKWFTDEEKMTFVGAHSILFWYSDILGRLRTIFNY